MASASGLLSNFSVVGLRNGNPMLSFRYSMFSETNTTGLNTCKSATKWISFRMERVQPLFAMSRGGSYGLKFDDEPEEDPFWLHYSKETMRALQLVLAFLVQQPGQLKYIEWPSFQETLRTASLTLVLVAALIVALCSLDSALSYVLSLLLRRPA